MVRQQSLTTAPVEQNTRMSGKLGGIRRHGHMDTWASTRPTPGVPPAPPEGFRALRPATWVTLDVSQHLLPVAACVLPTTPDS